MEKNKLPKNIRQIGEKEDWIRVYIEDYVHTYIQRLRGLQDDGVSGGILLGRKQRINGVMHLFIRGAVTAEDPFWRDSGQTPAQLCAENSVYFPDLEICGFFVSSKQNRNSEVDLVRIFETHFPSEYQVLFNVRDQEEEVFSFSGHSMIKLAGYYIYYEKNEEMQSYIIRQESLRALEKQNKDPIPAVGRRREREWKLGNGPSETLNTKQRENKEGGEEKGEKNSRKLSAKKKIKKGDMIVRLVSIAGIFILGFLLFSDQIKFSRIHENSDQNTGILSSILGESQAVPAGADSDYVNGTAAESSLPNESESSFETADTKDSEGNMSFSGQETKGAAGALSTKQSREETSSSEASETKGSSTEETASRQSMETVRETAQGASGSYVFPLRYLVKKGDSLYSISEKYYGNTDMVDAICLENNITDPSSLRYGTVLTLPKR